MRDGYLASLVAAFDAREVTARLRVTMLRHRSRLWRAVGRCRRVDLHRRSAVAEIPDFAAVRRQEGAHFERHRIARSKAERRRIAGVNGRREIVGLTFGQRLHHREVIVRPTARVGHFQDLTIRSRSIIAPVDSRPLRRRAVGKSPCVARDLSSGTPRTGAVQDHRFSDLRQTVGPGDRDEVGMVLALICLQQKRVSLLDAPFARRLPGLDVEVEVCPTTAAPFLPQHAELLSCLDASARLNIRVDGLKCA